MNRRPEECDTQDEGEREMNLKRTLLSALALGLLAATTVTPVFAADAAAEKRKAAEKAEQTRVQENLKK